MKKCLQLAFLLFFTFFLLSFQATATTINPFPNLGEMGKHAEAIVHVKVLRNYTEDINNATRFRTEVEVTESVKGLFTKGDRFLMQNHHRIIGEMESIVWGDLEIVEGEEYLLFLAGQKLDYWQPMMLSYGAFILREKVGQEFFVPMDLGKETHFYKGAGAITPEELGVYKAEALKRLLKQVSSGVATWDKRIVLSSYDATSFDGRGVPPGHCSFLFSSPIARWPDFETLDLPVSHHVAGDPGCATTAAEVAAGIGDLNANYAGISLSNGGTHTFVPTCVGEDATDAEFIAWVNANLGGSRNLVIQFDDPCDEIPDLSGCNGTLAFGGLWASSSTYTSGGMTWANVGHGYVVVNNGSGACQCTGGTDYQIMLEHEMSHSLNIGHISGSGTANMNPSCCNTISALDIECLDFLYAPAPLAIELSTFRGNQQGNQIELSWTTSMEVNNQFFTIEKRNDDSSFENILTIESRGDSDVATNYSSIDIKPKEGRNYYRLSHTDLSGKQTYMKTIEVDFYGQNSVSISPNPVQDNWVNIKWKSSKNGNLTVDIYDVQGNLVHSHSANVTKGSQQFPLLLENLEPGLYYVRSMINAVYEVEKLIVL